MPPNKLPGLEIVRFVAGFAVLIWHYQHFAYVADQPVDLLKERLPLYALLQPFYEAGRYGVWVFWCVSGFIFFWKYRDAIYERSTDAWTFFVLRLSRLYPLHLVTLMIVALLQPVYFHQHGHLFVYQDNDLQHFMLQIMMASEWGISRGDSFNGPIWSISVEVLVYIVFFLTLRFATRSALFNVLAVLVCLTMRGQVFSCLAFFYAGGLAAIARRQMDFAPLSAAIEGFGWSATALVAAAMWMFSSRLEAMDWVFCLTCTPLLLFCVSREISLPPLAQKMVEAAGNMTYSSYLTHFPLQLLIVLAFTGSGHAVPFYTPWFFAIYLTAMLLLSRMTYRCFETPVQALLRNKLLPRPRNVMPAPAPPVATAASLSAAQAMDV
jgi:peptidoglycan/LPS O-acetylase OafA/YrhL